MDDKVHTALCNLQQCVEGLIEAHESSERTISFLMGELEKLKEAYERDVSFLKEELRKINQSSSDPGCSWPTNEELYG